MGHLCPAHNHLGFRPQIETGDGELHGAGDGGVGQSGSLATRGGRTSVLEQASNAGEPFWGPGRGGAHRERLSTVARVRPTADNGEGP
jgi:hypothetical protein